jgi:hypothetical protein
MQKHDDQHKLWSRALAIYGASNPILSLRVSNRIRDVSRLSLAPVTNNVSAYIQKLLNVTCDKLYELDAHLAQAPMKIMAMDVDPETKQASLILMFSFTLKL